MILYVTSFNKSIYDSSGQSLVKSFVKLNSDGLLLAASQDGISIKKDRIINYNLDNDIVYSDFLVKESGFIPKKFGGTAQDCKCKIKDSSINVKHEKGCCHSLWNRRASRWAIKTFAMMHAITLDPECIIWIDSDCCFKRSIPKEFIDSVFGNYECFYHYGPFRRNTIHSAETGLMGFKQPAFKLIENVYKKYLNGKYKDDLRWDDSHLYTVEFNSNSEICRDLITDHIKSSHVVKLGPFNKYIEHNKGQHHREKIV